MATRSKYEQGYDDNRFEIDVGEEFHCSICLLVLKDPLMCENQHYYCSSCIKECLANSESCPTCRVHLSEDTLIQAPRIVTDYLSKLNIHCDFYPKGCREVIELSNLKHHVANCDFSLVHCSNDGCNALLNRKDKLHHEAEVCDFRKSKCHDCSQLKNEVKEIKNEMSKMKDEMKGEMNEMKRMIDKVLACQLKDKTVNENHAEEIKNQVTNEVKQMKEEIKKEMKEIVMNAVRDAMVERKDLKVEMKNSKKRSPAPCCSNVRGNIIVVGGIHKMGDNYARNKSTECFNWVNQTWTLLNSGVFEGRSSLCSFLYHGQMVVAGGNDNDGNKTNTLKCLDVADSAAKWKDFGVNLPFKCSGHQVVNCHDRLFISGGLVENDRGRSTRSDAVNELQLVPPYSSKMLTRLPQPRSDHGMELFDNKLFILGGYDGKTTTNSVVEYDLIKNECRKRPPLPYAVSDMATVLWQNNVLVIGGLYECNTHLNSVFIYDVVTGRSQMLPSMRRKRSGCTAVLTGSVVVVMGGYGDSPKSVECFDIQRQVWQDLPDMLEPRAYPTAVVKPNC